MNYWQHRISHQWDVSKQLFDKGFLTIGWQGLSQSEILSTTKAKGEEGFNQCAKELGLSDRNRWCLYRFFTMEPGDVVVVPLYEKEFAVVEITGTAEPISKLPLQEFKSVTNRTVKKEEFLVYEDSNSIIDLGYFIPFKRNDVAVVPRAFASAKLQSRMKHQFINISLDKLAEDVQEARVAKAPLDLRDVILESLAPKMLEAIYKLTPDGFERLIKWYMQKCGATNVTIPAKNESGKSDGADADVIAEFSSLGIVFFVQAKKHEGNTGEWAVEQIRLYKEQKENKADDFTYIPWVVSTAEFDETVRELAHDAGVRLVDGITFAKMLLDSGVGSINEVLGS